MKTFRTLDLAIEFYEQVSILPVQGVLRDQLYRAAASISLNLSEGNAKGSANEKRHFFRIAYGSLRECQTIFKLIKTENRIVLEIADQLGANLYRLLNSKIQDSPGYRSRNRYPISDI